MKHSSFNHPKMYALARLLKLKVYSVNGIMGRLWANVTQYAPTGDIGQVSPETILHWCGVELDFEPEQFVKALIDSHFLDRRERLLLVHDWPDHCEDFVHRKLARHGLVFADGSTPSLTKLSRDEKAILLKEQNLDLKEQDRDSGLQNRDLKEQTPNSHNKVRAPARAERLALEALRKTSGVSVSPDSSCKTTPTPMNGHYGNWKKAAAFIIDQFPATDERMIKRIVSCFENSMQQVHAHRSNINEASLLDVLKAGRGRKQESAAYWLTTIPTVCKNWTPK